MLYEKELRSLPRLLEEVRTLDIDAGVRTFGRYNSKKCVVFLTKSMKGFAVAIYSLKKEGKLAIPDKRLLMQELESEEDVRTLLNKVITKPLKAYSY